MTRAEPLSPSSWLWEERRTRSYRLRSQARLCPHRYGRIVHKMGLEPAVLWLKTVATVKEAWVCRLNASHMEPWVPGRVAREPGAAGAAGSGRGGLVPHAWSPSGFPGAGWGSRQRPPPLQQAGGKGELTLWPRESRRVGE